MTKLSDRAILKLQARGFVKWTKHGFNRLYVSPNELGLKMKFDKKKKVDKLVSATLEGKLLTKAEVRSLQLVRTYIDIDTGSVHSGDIRFSNAATNILNEVLKEVSDNK